MAESDLDDDPTITQLLAISEHHLHQTPPLVSESVRCLLATLTLCPSTRIEARVRLQLGLVLYHHTNNVVEARQHLDRAMLISQSASNLHDVSFEASSLAARIMVEQNGLYQAKSLLRNRLEISTRHPYWNVRLLLQLADIHMQEKDENSVLSTLDRCIEYASQVNATYTRLLCLLYKGAFLLTNHHYMEASEVLNVTSSLKDSYHGNNKGIINAFYQIVQVAHLLIAGQMKAAKPHLKQLQQQVKVFSSEREPLNDQSGHSPQSPDSFQWITKEQTLVMVYLLCVVHSVYGGFSDKALGYADKALQLINLHKEDSSVMCILRAHVLEHIISSLLMQGKTVAAGEKLHEVISVCHGHPQLVYSHKAVLHTLLGHYALATDDSHRAIQQFQTALKHTNDGDLCSLISVNLAVAYMKSTSDHTSELTNLMQALSSDSPNCHIKAAISYTQGLYKFTRRKIHDAKCQVREAMLLANKHDLGKLTSCSLIILGQIFMALGNVKEAQDMASPAIQLSTRIPDKRLQVWAASLLADLYHSVRDYSNEMATRQQIERTSSEVHTDMMKAIDSPNNKLAQWTVGDWPVSKMPKLSYPAPAFHRHVHTPHPTPTISRTNSQTVTRHQPIVNCAEIDTKHFPGRVNHSMQTKEDATVEKMEIESSQRSSQKSRAERYSQPEQLTPQSIRNMELKLHNVVNSPRVALKRNDNQSSATSIKSSPLALTKTPEIRLAKVVTPTDISISNRNFPLEDSLMRTNPEKLDITPSRTGNEYLREQIRPKQNPAQKETSMHASSLTGDNTNTPARMPHEHTSGQHWNSPSQSLQYGSSQQQFTPGYGPSNDLQQISRQHISPRNLTAQLTPHQRNTSSPHSNLTAPGFHHTHSPSPHSMSHHAQHPVHNMSNHLSHPQQLSHAGPPNYPTKQPSPHAGPPPYPTKQPSPHAGPPIYPTKQPSPQLNVSSLSPHKSPRLALHHSPENTQDSQHQLMLSPHHQSNVGGNHTTHLVQDGSRSLARHVRQASQEYSNVSLPTGSSLIQQQQMGTVPALSQINSFYQHPTIQQSLSSSQQQAVFQQRVLQQQQQMLQAQASQQHLLNLRQHNPIGNTPHTPALSQQSLQGALYHQQMLSQHPPVNRQLSHMNVLQRIGQEANQSSLGNTEALRMPALHTYRPQNAQQLQLMNGTNIGGTAQGGMYMTPNSQRFPFNPHQSGR